MRLIALLIFLSSFAEASQVHMQLGDYQGTDSSGRACDVYLGHPFGDEYMGFFWYLNASGSYRVSTAYDPQPTSPGRIKGTQYLMADGWDHSVPYYRDVYGSPIGAHVIQSQYNIRVKNRLPVSLEFVTDYGSSVCKDLKYTGPYRP
jgi:hypothetical protein